jgi:hypothetical protein
MSLLIHLTNLLISLNMRAQVGVATNFSPTGDPWNPVAYAACLHRDLRPTDLIVAHPTLPCNSKVFLYNTRNGRSVIARVGDRGPRHAMVDLAPATTKALRANGWETVVMISEESYRRWAFISSWSASMKVMLPLASNP